MGFGDRLKEARIAAGLNQKQLGSLIGVTGNSISNYENGTSSPNDAILLKMFDALNVEPNFLFQDSFALEEKAPASQQEPLISLDALTDLLKRLGFIRDSNDITEEDVVFLRSIFGILESWFSRKRG